MGTILFLVVLFGTYKLGQAAGRDPEGLSGVGRSVFGIFRK